MGLLGLIKVWAVGLWHGLGVYVSSRVYVNGIHINPRLDCRSEGEDKHATGRTLNASLQRG